MWSGKTSLIEDVASGTLCFYPRYHMSFSEKSCVGESSPRLEIKIKDKFFKKNSRKSTPNVKVRIRISDVRLCVALRLMLND
jgi:uncharacterized membrane protein YheB (UPF0754 family)